MRYDAPRQSRACRWLAVLDTIEMISFWRRFVEVLVWSRFGKWQLDLTGFSRLFASFGAAFVLSQMCFGLSSSLVWAGEPACDAISVTLTDNYFPFSFVDTQGKGNGIGFVVLQKAAARAGVAVDITVGLPWKRQLAMLKAGQSDAILAINFNEERGKVFVFSDSYYSNRVRVFVNNSAPVPYRELSDLKGYLGLSSNGASYGDRFDNYALENLTIRGVKGTEKLVEMLAVGRGDYMVLPEELGRQLIQAKGLSDKIVPVGPPVQSVPVHLAFSPRYKCPDLLAQVNAVIADLIADGSRERLLGELLSNNKNWER